MLGAAPALLLVAEIVLPVYDRVRPSPPASAQISALHSKLALCVGISSRKESRTDGADFTQESRTYLFVSAERPWPRLVTIEGILGTRVAVIEWGPLGLVVHALVIASCAWAVWKWWVRVYFQHGREGLRLAT